jgi:hypothetical protein
MLFDDVFVRLIRVYYHDLLLVLVDEEIYLFHFREDLVYIDYFLYRELFY